MASAVRRPFISTRALVLLIAAATVFALMSTAQSAVYLRYAGEPIPWVGLLKARLVNWYLYALFVPLLYRLALARPIDRRSWPAAVPLHLSVGLTCAIVKEGLFTLIGNWFRPGVFRLTEILAGDYFDEVLIFCAMIAIIHGYLGWARVRSEPTGGEQPNDRFMVSGIGGYRMVPVNQVEWIEAQGNYAQLNTKEGGHLVRETMASLERRLGDGFVRVHRGAIVNRLHIQRIEPRSHGAYAITLSSGSQVVTSRSYNGRLRSLIG
jgi:hypothetical protein